MLENYKSYTYLIYFAKINSKWIKVLNEVLNHKVIGGNGKFSSSGARITQNIENILIIKSNVLIILKFCQLAKWTHFFPKPILCMLPD